MDALNSSEMLLESLQVRLWETPQKPTPDVAHTSLTQIPNHSSDSSYVSYNL
jgi:hypothetical protein